MNSAAPIPNNVVYPPQFRGRQGRRQEDLATLVDNLRQGSQDIHLDHTQENGRLVESIASVNKETMLPMLEKLLALFRTVQKKNHTVSRSLPPNEHGGLAIEEWISNIKDSTVQLLESLPKINLNNLKSKLSSWINHAKDLALLELKTKKQQELIYGSL
jgi:hypothetical protein